MPFLKSKRLGFFSHGITEVTEESSDSAIEGLCVFFRVFRDFREQPCLYLSRNAQKSRKNPQTVHQKDSVLSSECPVY